MRAVLQEHRRAAIDAVLPGIEFYVATASRVAAVLGLPGIAPEHANAPRDKTEMHATAVASGLRRPVQCSVEVEDELADTAVTVGFPAVLKPRDSAGSIHVTRVEDLGEACRAYRAMSEDRLPDDVGRRIGARAVLEGYVDGPEFSLDGYVDPGGPRLLSVTKKYLSEKPHFVEIGHLVGPWHDAALQQICEAFVDRLCAAFGLTSGPFHAEVRQARDGELVLIELGARRPGGRIARLVELVTGVSLPLVALAAALGRPAVELGAFGKPGAAYTTASSLQGSVLMSEEPERRLRLLALRRVPPIQKLLSTAAPPHRATPRETPKTDRSPGPHVHALRDGQAEGAREGR